MKINRAFFEYLDEDLVMAIKTRKEPKLIDRFQEYWKKRCNNPEHLSQPQVLSILMNFAMNNFTRSEWYQYNDYFRFHGVVENNDRVSVILLIDAYLIAILLMQMVYDSEELPFRFDPMKF